MAEPYKKVGRGGAGNFYGPKDIECVSKAAAVEDLEAQTSPASATRGLTCTETSTAPPPEYQHTGRGGAGNWVKPTELESHGFSQENDSNPNATSTVPTVGAARTIGGSKPTYRGGRGGAGNYTDVEAERRATKEREDALRREMGLRAERDVEAGLARPPQTYRGIGGVWELGDMK